MLSEKEDSFYWQLEMPTKRDWASGCLKDLKELEIALSLKEIEEMLYNKERKSFLILEKRDQK